MGVLFLPGQSEHLAYEGEDPQVGEAIRFRDFSLTLVSSFTEGSGILRTDAEIEESSQALEPAQDQTKHINKKLLMIDQEP